MKRTASFVAVLALAALAAGAQEFPTLPGATNSLESTVTKGLILNAIDSSFNPWDDFGSADSAFIFAGLSGNPFSIKNSNTLAGGLRGGYYQPGAIPFSAYVDASAAGFTNALSTSYSAITAYDPATGVKTGETVYTYKQPSTLSSLDVTARGLLKFSGITTGLFFTTAEDWLGGSATDAGYSGLYETAAVTTYSGTTANYTTTTSLNNLSGPIIAGNSGTNTITSSNTFYIPFALKTGDLKHFGIVGLNLKKNDSSAAYSNIESAWALAGGPALSPDRSITIKSYNNATDIAAIYGVALPGFLMKDKGAEFSAGVAIEDTIKSNVYDYDSTTKNYNLATASQKNGVSGAYQKATATYDTLNDIGIAVYVDHSLPYAPAEGMKFIVRPRFSATFATVNSWDNPSKTVSYSQVLDANFAYDNAAYNRTTTTYSGATSTTTNIGLGASLPMGFEYKPATLPFGFFAGSVGKMSFVWSTTTSPNSQATTVTDSITGTTVTAGTPVYSWVSDASTTTKLTPAFSEVHSLGLFVPFADNIRLDISLNGWSLLDFDNFTCQVVIPLK
jgi:hypothetical protein